METALREENGALSSRYSDPENGRISLIWIDPGLMKVVKIITTYM